MEKLPADLISQTANHCCFLDDKMLCYIDGLQMPRLVVVHADDDHFQTNLVPRSYHLHEMAGAKIKSLVASNGVLLLTAIHLIDGYRTLRSWKLEIPDSSILEGVNCHLCGELGALSMSIDAVDAAHSNGHLITAIVDCRRRTSVSYEKKTVVHDLRTGNTHVISKRPLARGMGMPHKEDRILPITATVALRLGCQWSEPTLTVVHIRENGIERVDYRTALPRHVVDMVGGRYISGDIILVGNRFFIKLRNILFMAYIPGTDVPLEELAAMSIWQGLPACEQKSLMETNLLSNRSLLLRACSEEQKRNETRGEGKKKKYGETTGTTAKRLRK